MKKLLFILIFIPLISFGQENVLNIETIKDEYIKVIAGITYYNEKPYTGVFYRNYKNGQLRRKVTYKSGKKDGLVEEYSINGQLKEKILYKNGEIILNYRSVIGDTNIEDVNVYDLEAMVRLFQKDISV